MAFEAWQTVCVRERRGLSKHKETGMVRDGNLAL
jgi:hypothetical protein